MTTLQWRGPISLVDGAASYSLGDPKFHSSGVYIYSQIHTESVGIYVGKSDNVRRRIFEHIAGFAGGTYWLRDEHGEWVYDPQDGMTDKGRNDRTREKRSAGDLPQLIQHNLNILSFIWAAVPLEQVNAVEAYLIAQACGLAHEKQDSFICENGQYPEFTKLNFKHQHTIKDVFTAEILNAITSATPKKNKGGRFSRRP